MRSLGGVSDSLKTHLTGDYSSADLPALDKLILRYAERLTCEAHRIDHEFIESLKTQELTDRMLHDIVQVTAYFNYVNRVADGLGVELEHI